MADRRLQVFHTVAKQLSFTKAAELLFMTQPAVTFQVKQLEEHFNTRLFERSHGKISLTPAGELALDYAERILNMTGEMEARISELTGQVSGPLLIGASTTIAEYMLPRLLGEFKRLHPETQARLTVANSETIENKVADHTLDMGLIESPSHHPNLVTQVCCEDELVMICAPFSDLAKLQCVNPKQVAGHPYISRESGSGTRECIDDFFKMNGVSLDEVNSGHGTGQPGSHQGRRGRRPGRGRGVQHHGGQGSETGRTGGHLPQPAPAPPAFPGLSPGKIPQQAAPVLPRLPGKQSPHQGIRHPQEVLMTADERRLLRVFRALPENKRSGLLDYAEFLLNRVLPDAPETPVTPLDIPRPPEESVVKAIKRLRETYPMVDRAKILNDTSACMTAHLIHGKPAEAVIDELEALFLRHYQSLSKEQ
jgi:DNA-binding transcriptional LysR family regulator